MPRIIGSSRMMPRGQAGHAGLPGADLGRVVGLSADVRVDPVIAVTLHNDTDVVMAIPVIQPGMTCSLALAGTRSEPCATGVRSVANIGLAYDHRFINGRDAIMFLRAVKKALESPATLIKGGPRQSLTAS